MANIKDVAEQAGVSTATVSHVINNTRFVSKETRIKVMDAMEDLNYHPNLAARSLRSQRSNIVGLLVPDVANPFYMTVIKGVEKVMRKAGYNLLVSNSDDDMETEKSQLKIFNAQLIDGLIMRATVDDHKFLESHKDDYPTVFIDCKPLNYNDGDCVLVNNIEGSFNAVNLFIEKGHKKIGMIGGIPGLTTTEERIEGYKKALRENGLEIDENLIRPGNSRIDSGYRYAKELVEHKNVTALYTGNNLITIGAMKYLKENDIIIPDNLALIGFDDREWSSITEPPLTSVRQPSYEIGKKAGELLLKRIRGQKKDDYQVYRLPVQLIKRKSD